MDRKHGFRWFNEDACDRCGQCLQACAVLGLPESAARADISALIDRDVENSLAFQFCNTCNACDLVCPQGADPYELVLENFGDYLCEHGLPFLAKMIFPNEPENFWSGLRVLMGNDELSLLESWDRNRHTPTRQILLAGFYTNIVPYLTRASILDELRPMIVGCEGMWGCGGDSNKLGAIGLTEQIIELVRRQFNQMGVERVYCFMETEAAMLSEVLPRRFGADFGIEALPLDDWVLERLERGDVKIAGRLNLRATVHDNCMSRYFGGRPQEVVRRIVEITGCELVEMKHNRDSALCCGWAATIPTLYGRGSDNPLRTLMGLLVSLDRRLQEGVDTGADVMVASCPACYIFLSMIKELVNAPVDVVHPLELVQMAMGEPPLSRAGQRSWDILAISTNLLLKWAASKENRRRFFPKPIEPANVEALPEISPKDARRLRAISRFYRGPVVQNRATRALTAALVRLCIAGYRSALGTKLR